MRVALVSPYSWTYPGGVSRHIEALARELGRLGHDVRVLAPYDAATRAATLRHRGMPPQERELPDWVVPIGGTVGWPSNGASSNLALTPGSASALRTALARERFDVVHLHEPVAPVPCWDALVTCAAPLVGTFHCYSESAPPHAVANLLGARRRLNRLHVRIAVSEAAAWTGRRFYGGEYRIIPNGVELPGAPAPAGADACAGRPLRVAFVGQAVERKGLPLLLRAFEALRDAVPAELTLVGVDPGQVAPLVHELRGIRALGRVDDATKRAVLARADVLCAPSLGGESFGMVLTEAFAAGTPVVASDIAGYRDVVRHGKDGLLVAPGDATALAETLRALARDPARLAALARGAAASAPRYAWPVVAERVLEAYDDAIGAARTARAQGPRSLRRELGVLPADGGPRRPARRLPSLEPEAATGRLRRTARKAAFGVAGVAAAAGALLAVQRIGLESIVSSLLASSPAWVLLGLALMCASMVARAGAWRAILQAALPGHRVRFADAFQGTCIGVLMSATLPARLGEPARALVVARRLGQPRTALPAVTGSVVSQSLLNVLALVVLGAVMFATVGLFAGRQQALLWYALAPLVILGVVLVAPALVRGRRSELVDRVRSALAGVRSGLAVFRRPRLGAVAATAQLGAWAIQWVACYVLLVGLGLDDRAGPGAAAAVLFAVNVSAVLPLTPSNLGVFQAACVAVLTGAYGVGAADAFGYGIVLQAVEVATALVMGMPALVKEGVSWREIRLRALHAAPVTLTAAEPARQEA